MLNRIIVIGRLVRDPELNYTGSGTAVSNFTLAVERNFTNKNTGERDVDFIKVTVWQKLAENCSKYLKKGRMAAAEGQLHINKNKGKDGKTYIDAFINANNVQFLGGSNSSNEQQNTNSSNRQTPPKNNENKVLGEPPDDFPDDIDDMEDEFDVPF